MVDIRPINIPVLVGDPRRIVEKCDRCGAKFGRIPLVDALVYCGGCGPTVIDTNLQSFTIAI